MNIHSNIQILLIHYNPGSVSYTHLDVYKRQVQMPVMNGYEATKQIRALDNPALAGITILAMTANAFDEDKKHWQRCV